MGRARGIDGRDEKSVQKFGRKSEGKRPRGRSGSR
jgi:hypothetical protein